MKKLLFTLCMLGGVSAVRADWTIFPDAAGTHDLATSESWGGITPDDTLEALILSNGTYTASQDFTMKTLRFKPSVTQTNVVIDLTAGLPANGVRTVNLSGGLGFDGEGSGSVQRSGKLTFRGGYWNLNGSSFSDSGYRALKNTELTVSGAAIITNVGSASQMTYSQSGRKLHVVGGSKIYVKRGVSMSTNSSTDGLIRVAEGSELHYAMDGNDSFSTCQSGMSRTKLNHRIVVEGQGSLIKGDASGATLSVGYNKCGSSLLVTNRAAVATGSVRMMTASNRIDVVDNASIAVNTLSVGSIATNMFVYGANQFRADHATVTVGDVFGTGLNGCGYNTSIISNSRVTVKNALQCGDEGAVSNTVVFVGDDSQLAFNSIQLRVGAGNSIVFDGVDVVCSNSVRFLYATNCVLRLENGASLFMPTNKSINVGWGTSADQQCVSNTLYVGNGSLVDVDTGCLSSDSARLILSNGTFRSRSGKLDNWTMNGLQFGYDRNEDSNKGTNCVLVMRGTTPRLESGGQLTFCRSSTIRWEIPENGYAADWIPIVATNISFKANQTFEVDVDAYLACGTKRTFTLLHATGSMSMEQTSNCGKAVTAANARIAADELSKGFDQPRYQFRLHSSRKLLLDVTPVKGLMLFFY